jgi:Uma2 family endonuclease
MGLIEIPRLPMTAEEFQELPEVEGARLELWEGSLVVTAAAQMAWHSAIARRIEDFFRAAKLETLRELGVIVAPHDVPVPDVLVFREPIKDLRRSQFPAEDLMCVVEVVSPESKVRDIERKPAKYAAARIPEFWLATEDTRDPFEAQVEIYRLTVGGGYALAQRWTLSDLERAGYDSRLGDSRLGA